MEGLRPKRPGGPLTGKPVQGPDKKWYDEVGQHMPASGNVEATDSKSIEALPPLKSDCVRLVHIADPGAVAQIRKSGLDYKSQGMISSTARWWADSSHVEYWANDPRLNFEGAQAVVMDVPANELRLHNDPTRAPGSIPAKYIVGIVEAKDPSEKRS